MPEPIDIIVLNNCAPIVSVLNNCPANIDISEGLSLGNYVIRQELLNASGFLQSEIDLISSSGDFLTTGDADARYYPLLSNPSNYLTSADTGVFANIFYPLTNPSGFITGFNSGLYVLKSESGQFVSIYNSGNLLGRWETGRFYDIQNVNNYSTSGNLFDTGSFLLNRINNLSGYTNNTFATILNLQLTGSNLQSQLNSINSITGSYTGLFYPRFANPLGYLISTDLNPYATVVNLENTGNSLYNSIITLSGELATDWLAQKITVTDGLYFGGSDSNSVLLKNLGFFLQLRKGDDSSYTDLLGGSLYASAPSIIGWNGRSLMYSPDDGEVQFINGPGVGFDRLILGPANYLWPALKAARDTGVQIRTADDNNFTNLQALNISGQERISGFGFYSGDHNLSELFYSRDNPSGYVTGFNGIVNLPDTIVYSTGNQNISGIKSFVGTLRAQGGVDESAQGFDRIDLGVQAGTPRIVLENAGYNIWLMDNDIGTFRKYVPPYLHTIDSFVNTDGARTVWYNGNNPSVTIDADTYGIILNTVFSPIGEDLRLLGGGESYGGGEIILHTDGSTTIGRSSIGNFITVNSDANTFSVGNITASNFNGSGFYSGNVNLFDIFYPRNNPSGYLTGASVSLPNNLISGNGITNYIPRFIGGTGITSGSIIDSGNVILFTGDARVDIGTSSAGRPRFVYASNKFDAPSFQWGNNGYIAAQSNGVVLISDNGANDFNRFQFGGTNSSYPSIKRIGPGIGIKLADDSAFTDLQARNITGASFYSGVLNFGDIFYNKNNPSGFITNFNLTGASGSLQTQINNLNNPDIVYTTGDQIINGVKSFFGNVGIKNSSPSYNLDTVGTIRMVQTSPGFTAGPYALSLQNNSSSTWLEILNNGGANKGIFFGIENNDFQQWNYQGGPISFYTATTASAGSERLRIAGNGNIGISQTVPLARLHVGNSLGGDVAIALENSNGVGYFGLTNSIFYSELMNGGSFAFYNYGFTNQILTILDGGNIGVNTVNPIAKLDVSGLIQSNGLNVAVIRPTWNNIGLATTGEVIGASGVLQGQINSIPVYLTTGNADLRYVSKSESGQFASSSNLFATGSFLDNKITSLSGYTITNLGIVNTNIQLTGSNLQSQINSINLATGGYTGLFYPRFLNPSGYLVSENLNSYATINFVTGISGSLQNQIYNSGTILLNLISAASAGVSSINGQSGILTLAGAGNVSVITNGPSFIVSGNTGAYSTFASVNNLELTGSNLQGQINGLPFLTTGNADVRYLLKSESGQFASSGGLFSTGSFLNLKIDSLSGYSNSVFATTVSLNGASGVLQNQINILPYLTTGNGDSRYILKLESGQFASSGNLFLTGAFLDGKINSLSGYSNSTFSTILNLNGASGTLQNQINNLPYLTTGNADVRYVSKTESGQFASSGNLYLTGLQLDNKINVLSGYGNNTFATIGNLQLTGSNLKSEIDFINLATGGYTGLFYPRLANPSGYLITGNLSSYSTINFVTGASGVLQSQILNSGQLLLNLISAASAGVSSINGQSGILGFTGAGNVSVLMNGSNFIFSGNTGAYANFASILNLELTGSNLQSQINALPYLTTGNGDTRYLLRTETGQFALSGNLFSTGSQLDNKINNLSGYSNSTFATILNLQSTGSNIQNQINAINSATGSYTGLFYPRFANPSGYLVTGNLSSYATTNFVTNTSGVLQGQLNNLPITNIVYTTGNQSIGGVKSFTGNVGIGISNPIYPLDIEHNGYFAAHFKTTNNLGQTSYYMENDRGSFGSYGGFLYGSSASSLGNLFGAPRADRLFMFADGVNNLGMYVGTLSSAPFIIGTNSIERARFDSVGNFGINTNNPTVLFDVSGSIQSNSLNITSIRPTWRNTGLSTTGELNSSSGILQGQITNSGITLLNLITSAANAGVTAINGQSGLLNITGAGNVSVILNGSNFTISGNTGIYSSFASIENLQLTGSNLQNQINILPYLTTGNADLRYPLRSETGQFASSSSLFSTGSQLDIKINNLSEYTNNTFATISNLQLTGFNLQLQINSINSATGNYTGLFYPLLTNPSGYLVSTDLGTYATINFVTGVSGIIQNQINALPFLTTGNADVRYSLRTETGQFASSGNLYITGSQLDTKINTLSGYSNSTFATITNLGVTGENLQGQINALPYLTTGNADVRYPLRSETGQFASSGSLFSTGDFLDNKINVLSGYANTTFSTVANLQLTGSNLQTQVNLINSATGGFTGLFYPRFANPSGYLTSSDLTPYATTSFVNGVSGALSTQSQVLSGYIDNNFYLKSNPSGFINNLNNYLDFNTGVNNPNYREGRLFYQSGEKTLCYYPDVSGNILNIGQEEWIRVINVNASPINNGSVVYISGSVSGYGAVSLAKADAETTSFAIGVATNTIASNSFGYITAFGIVHGMNLAGFTAGAKLYLSETVAGGLTSSQPTGINFTKTIGYVTATGANGNLLVIPSSNGRGSGYYISTNNISGAGSVIVTNNNGLIIISGSGSAGGGGNPSSLIGSFGFSVDGGGFAISPGFKSYVSIPYNGTINDVTMLADITGNIAIDIWKTSFANYPPTVTNSIVGTGYPIISGNNKAYSLLPGWTDTTITAGDVFAFSVRSGVSGISKLSVNIKTTKI